MIRAGTLIAAVFAWPLAALADEGDWGAIHGSVDASYDYNDANSGTPAFHVFDLGQNTFSLHQINLGLTKSFPEGVSATFNGIFGDDATVISPKGNEFDLTQGFFTYKTGCMSIKGGRYTTLAGIETINQAGNYNASRGLLFSQQPFAHTGLRATCEANQSLWITLGVNNGSIKSKTDTNKDKTVEAQVAFWPASNVGVFLTGYNGNENPTGSLGKLHKDTYDLVVRANVTKDFSVALNADQITIDNGSAGKVKNTGVAAYANVKFGQFRIAPRLEYLNLQGDPTNPNFWARDYTVTLGYAPAPNLEFMAEGRIDEFDATGDNDQFSGTVKTVFKF